MNYLAKDRQSKTILLVDDQPNNLQLLLRYLNNFGYKILIAQNGHNAIETATAYHPDLILLDIMMSGIDGFTTCINLKKCNFTKDIPVIFMTGLTTTENKLKGFGLGAVDYITKPINQKELLARIKTHLALQSLNQRLVRDARRQKLLLEISDRIRQSLDLNSILKTAAQEIQTFLECDRVWLVHLDNHNIFLKAEAQAGNIKLGRDISWENFCDYQEEYLIDQQENIRVVQPIKHKETKAELSPLKQPIRIITPILINSTQPSVNVSKAKNSDTLWGWLIIDYQEAWQWHSEENKLLTVLTTQLAIGIKQALLFKQLSQQTSIDFLTNVYNRRYFDRQLNLEWGRLKRTSSSLSLIMCDVDYFKLYNDTYGHQRGDRCLQQVAKAISSVIKRPADIIARYGGEEFSIILPQTTESGAIKVAEAIRMAVKQLGIPHLNSSVDSIVTVSSGVAHTIPNSQNSPQLLIEAADLALYRSKEDGRNCITVYPYPISHARNQKCLESVWVERIRQALDNDFFSLYAQPITPLDPVDRKKYFEVLLRLTDQGEEVITPNFFLDIAERNSLMPDIDIWVINTLLEQLASQNISTIDVKNKLTQGQKANHKLVSSTNKIGGRSCCWQNHRFSINLSGASLNSEAFLEFLIEKLTNYHLPGELFCFEITETVAVSDLDKVAEFIKTLKNLGCSFALDDFGTGMSSLNYLKQLPVDYLKIDGSFIKELNQHKTAKVMVEAINHIAEGMGLKTVAEFVENQAILDTLMDLKIDYAQGFLFGRPEVLMNAIA